MTRRFVLFVSLLALASLRAADDKNAPATTAEELASPTASGALGASLAAAPALSQSNGPDGTVRLSWVEPVTANRYALRCATLDAKGKKWGAPRTIASGPDLGANSADFPQLVFGPAGHATAVWSDGHGGGFLTESADRGSTWSPPVTLVLDGHDVEKISLAVLADGRVLAAWLDGRSRKSGGKARQLFAHVLAAPGLPAEASARAGPDVLIDPSVCDCCQTTLTAFPDGGALLAYRGRTDEEVRDIRTARFRGQAWDDPRPLNHDDWRLAACPVNGPRLASDGGRVAVAWFTAADNDPRVLASYSPDAGARFLQPLRIDNGKPTGPVDTLILHDGAMLVTWLESDGSVWLRRVTPDFATDAPVRLAPAGATSVKSVPRVALVRDYAGGKTSAQFVAAFAASGEAPLRTLLVTVPEGELLDAEKNCDCAPTAEELQGFPLRGTIAAVAVDRGVLRVRHDELPGVLAAGMREFRVSPDLIAAVQTGREFLGRVERRDGVWWLFDVRLFAAPAPTRK